MIKTIAKVVGGLIGFVSILAYAIATPLTLLLVVLKLLHVTHLSWLLTLMPGIIGIGIWIVLVIVTLLFTFLAIVLGSWD